MRAVPFTIAALITFGFIFALNRPWGQTVPMPLGKLLSPSHGLWRNAESKRTDFGGSVLLPDLEGKATVYLDERLVPHVFATNEQDLYFVQGYLHARFRLFQMDLQTRAATGRASEIAGEKAVEFDRLQRRLGMTFAAENSLVEMEKDPVSKIIFDAYTAGVNAWIASLTEEDWPIEYKILNIQPEPWSNLRTALLLKMMAKMLSSGTENDLAFTNAKAIFTADELKILYPQVPDSLKPIVSAGTPFSKPAVLPVAPADVKTRYFDQKIPIHATDKYKPNSNNGSNNWVLAGSKTKSGSPILCNDPHLELSLPSIWYEMQLTGPHSSTYGVSLPGSPYIIIGFNEFIAWGITNSQRDVKDYYEIKFRDKTKTAYWYNGDWKNTRLRIEEIKIKNAPTQYDTVAYTVFGPVLFDQSFSNDFSAKRNLAVRWTAHDPSNEGQTFLRLSRAKTYADYEVAIKSFNTPGQNFVFAAKDGDIAIWQQGKFPARWEGQGLYVMPGTDSSYRWQGFIPQEENPHAKNPVKGFLQSANQRPTDKNYPYFIPGSYINARGLSIDEKLTHTKGATVEDMMKLQSDYDNVEARYAKPILLKFTDPRRLSPEAKRYLQLFRDWNLQANPAAVGQTIYQYWMDNLEKEVWQDELSRITPAAPYPNTQTLIELMLKDTVSTFYDRIDTPERETLRQVVTNALSKATALLSKEESSGKLAWGKHKNFTVYHLLKDALPSFGRSGLNMGGAGNIINAITHSHGPSWRMIVALNENTEAYGVYPAGQNGNPGSRFYDNFVDTWAKGEYYPLWMMKMNEAQDPRVKWTLNFSSEARK